MTDYEKQMDDQLAKFFVKLLVDWYDRRKADEAPEVTEEEKVMLGKHMYFAGWHAVKKWIIDKKPLLKSKR